MKKVFRFLLVVVIPLLFAACNQNLVFEHYKSIEQQNWHKDSILVFNVDISDTLQNHNIYFNVRNDINYEYSNLWLFVEIKQPNGESLNDKFEIALADRSGKWLGEGLGGIRNREVVFRRNVYFPVSGEYTILVKQGMREEVLSGISDIGVRIEIMN